MWTIFRSVARIGSSSTDRPRRHGVVRLAPTAHRRRLARVVLRARGYGPRVVQLRRLDQPIYHRRLSPRRFDEVNLRSRESNGEDEAGKPCTCAYIRDSAGGYELRNLQARQAVRHVNLKRRLRVRDARVRIRLCG